MGKKWDGSGYDWSEKFRENADLPGFKHATTSNATRNNNEVSCSSLGKNVLSMPEVKWLNWCEMTTGNSKSNNYHLPKTMSEHATTPVK